MSQNKVNSLSPAVTDKEKVRVFGSASLSNLGPGFDALGLCIDGLGDIVEARITDEPGVTIESIDKDSNLLPRAADQNTASVGAQAVIDQAGVDVGMSLRIEKGIPLGSGVGGSAASAVAGAWAANVLLGSPFDRKDLLEAVLEAELVADGAHHGDNVLPALFGGLVLVASSQPTRYRQIRLPDPLHIALVLPDVQVLTRDARDCLPETVPLNDAIHNAAELAFLIEAMRAGDWEAAGETIMTDRLVEPVRAKLVPTYNAIRETAVAEGAYGCALSGSGPAMFAMVGDEKMAESVSTAMAEASRENGINAESYAVRANRKGTVCLDAE